MCFLGISGVWAFAVAPSVQLFVLYIQVPLKEYRHRLKLFIPSEVNEATIYSYILRLSFASTALIKSE